MVSFVTIRYKGMLYKVSLEPMTTLYEVLVNFCEQHQLDPALWCFKHHRLGFVSMNSPFSLTGIETNAQLEMTLAPADVAASMQPAGVAAVSGASVNVALEMPSATSSSASDGQSSRFTHPFPPSTSLWDVLSAVEEECGEHLVTRTDPPLDPKGVYMIPVARLMRRSFDSLELLKTTTLRKLGFKDGNVLIRLDFKRSDPPMYRQDVQKELQRLDALALKRTTSHDSTDGGGGTAAAASASVGSSSASSAAAAAAAAAEPENDSENKETVPLDGVAGARAALHSLKEEAEEEAQAYEQALGTLLTITRNLVKRPGDIKYRSLKLHKKLEARVGRWAGARNFLRCLGFVADSDNDPAGQDGALVMSDSVTDAHLNKCLDVLEAATEVQQRLAQQEALDRQAEEQAAANNAQWSFVDPEEEAKIAEARQKEAEKRAPVVSVFDKPIVSAEDEQEEPEETKGIAAAGSTSTSCSLDDIKAAVSRANFSGASDEDMRAALKTVQTIAQNLLKSGKDVKPAFRDLNPAHEKFHAKVGRWQGCREVLRLLGFRKTQNNRLVLSAENESRQVVERVVAILGRTLEEQFTKVDWTAPARDVLLYDLTTKPAVVPPTATSTAARPEAAGAEVSQSEDVQMSAAALAKEEQRLLMKAFADSQKQNALRERFTTREQREAERLARVAQYDRTLIRVTFQEDQVMLRVFLHPKESINELFLVLDKYVSEELKNKGYHFRIPPATRITRPVARKATLQSGADTLQKLGLVPAANLRCWPNTGSPSAGMVSAAALKAKVPYQNDVPPQRIGANNNDTGTSAGASDDKDPSGKAGSAPTDEELERMMEARMKRAAAGKSSKPKSKPKTSGASSSSSSSSSSGAKKKGGFSLRDVMAERGRKT